MAVKPVAFIVALALVTPLTGASHVWAQGQGKGKDDSLESLLKELNEPEKPAAKSNQKSGAGDGNGTASKKAKEAPRSSSAAGKSGKASADAAGKPATPRSRDAGKVSPKDQALDELLGKLGETKDEPTPEDHPRNGAPGGQPQPPPRGQKSGADKLGEKDQDLDQRLEELTGRKKKRPSSDQQRTGAVGEMIKEMREVEERLGKPDPSEDTQKKQKEIVKRIESMIEQAKRSGSSGRRMTVRQVPRPGQQQPGQDQGDQTGAQARGAPPMKPDKPTSQHSTANGKDIWGHLPDELRQMMESTFKEAALEAKRELIDRYFLSVAKGKPVREE